MQIKNVQRKSKKITQILLGKNINKQNPLEESFGSLEKKSKGIASFHA